LCLLASRPYGRHAEDCIASVYAIGDLSQPGRETASGIPLDDNELTAAHKSLPFGSKVKVTNKKTISSRLRSQIVGLILKVAALM
jgi:rare lipoprotein A (peptidoglycan hydrolase)